MDLAIKVNTKKNELIESCKGAGYLFYAVLLILLLTNCDNPPRNIKLVTYNVQQSSPNSHDGEYYDENGNALDDEDRATLIANRIRIMDADVVALNEVFDEDSRQIFSDIVGKTFPFHVDYIGGDSDPEDSGLMLFSKHPFLPLGNIPGDLKIDEGDIELVSPTGKTEDAKDLVAFVSFDQGCSEYDCYADKGAAMVKLENIFTQNPFVVVFSHTQASYGSDDTDDTDETVEERRKQFRQIASMLKETLVPAVPVTNDQGITVTAHDLSALQRMPVFILGDLNVDGNPWHSFGPGKASLDTEWQRLFGPSSSGSDLQFFNCGDATVCAIDVQNPTTKFVELIPSFIESWAFDTDSADLGRTSGRDPFVFDYEQAEDKAKGQRLDYILYRGPSVAHKDGYLEFPMIPQHLTTEWAIAGKNGIFSDHLPIAGNFLLTEDDVVPSYCTPLLAREVSVPNSNPKQLELALSIEIPGAMQWIKLNDSSATYSIATSPDIGFEIYKPYDLSRPIEFIEKKEEYTNQRTGEVLPANTGIYQLTSPPYYIRTFAKFKDGVHNRVFDGDYFMFIREHRCTGPDDYCKLSPSDSVSVQLPNKPVNPDDQLWFLFETDQSDKGDFPRLEFCLEREFASTNFEFGIAETIAPYAQLSPNPLIDPATSDGGKKVSFATDSLPGENTTGSETIAKAYFLTVKRMNNPTVLIEVEVSFTTNLTYFSPIALHCIQEEDDPSANDEIFFYLDMDGAPKLTDGNALALVNSGQLPYLAPINEAEDGGKPYPLNKIGVRKFINFLAVGLIEEDDQNGEYESDDLQVFRGFQNNWKIDTLARKSGPTPIQNFAWRDIDNPEDKDHDDTEYSYIMTYRLRHEQ